MSEEQFERLMEQLSIIYDRLSEIAIELQIK